MKGLGSSDIMTITQMQVRDFNEKKLEEHKEWLEKNSGYRNNPEKVKEHRELFGDLYSDKNDIKLPPQGQYGSADILAMTQMQVADNQDMKKVIKQINASMVTANAKYRKAHQDLLNRMFTPAKSSKSLWLQCLRVFFLL